MKRALIYASVASMIDLFNMENIKLLQKMGYRVDVACNFIDGNITSDARIKEFILELDELKVHHFQIPIPRQITKIDKIKESILVTKKLAKENNYDIVHCHSPIGSVICRWVFKDFDTRIIYTAHGFHFFKSASFVNWLIYYPIERLMARYTDDLITINDEDFKRAKKFRVRNNVYKINGIGVSLDKFSKNLFINREDLLKDFQIINKDYLLVSVGQLSKRKNHKMVIEAMSRIGNPSLKYIIIGDGELKESLKKLIKQLNLSKNVFLLGYKKNVGDYLSVADAYIFPSEQEGLPASLMESMAIGLPAIVSNIRGNSDLIDDYKGGYLFSLKNINSLVEAITEATSNSSLSKKQGLYNQNKIKTFSDKYVNMQMKKIYHEEGNDE